MEAGIGHWQFQPIFDAFTLPLGTPTDGDPLGCWRGIEVGRQGWAKVGLLEHFPSWFWTYRERNAPTGVLLAYTSGSRQGFVSGT